MANETPCGRCGHIMEDVGSQNASASTSAQIANRERRLTCPKCGHETTPAETAPEGEVESWEHEGGSAWGHDEGPWEG